MNPNELPPEDTYEDQMIDALLKEQACAEREQAIQEVENAILAEDVSHAAEPSHVDWKRLLVSGSIAAAVVLGFGYLLSMFVLPNRNEQQGSDQALAFHSPEMQHEAPGVLPQRRVPKETVHKPSAPAASYSKMVGAAVPSVELGPTNDYGLGWSARHGDLDRVHGGERYGQLVDPGWQNPLAQPLSTFSVDVDNASYSNIRRMIQEGRSIPRDAVRIEECINAFTYDYAAPRDGSAFAVHTELMTCPWNERHALVKVALKGREVVTNARPASNLVFLIDVSGSMQSSNKLPLVKQSLSLLLEQLDERDVVSYVVYAGSDGVVLPPTRITEEGRAKAQQALDRLESGGSTNGGAGIKRAYAIAEQQFIKGGVNRVILASDGDFNVGITDKNSLVEMVRERAASNIYLSALAFGTGNLNDEMFEAISNKGNGNYFYIDSLQESRKVFLTKLTSTLVTIAKDVKLQIEFNPQRVASYRLIGYANRVMRKEDFDNDQVDAGDIGAGHTVTAFYEVIPTGSVADHPAPDAGLKYQRPIQPQPQPQPKQVVGPEDEWLTLKLRHKHPEGDVSALQETVVKGGVTPWNQASLDSRFASAVALFGMKLRNMEGVGQVSWDQVSKLAEQGLRPNILAERAEFLGLIKTLKTRQR